MRKKNSVYKFYFTQILNNINFNYRLIFFLINISLKIHEIENF